MAHGGDGGDVDVVGVGEIGTLVDEALQAGGVGIVKAGEIVVTELIDDDRDYQFGLGGRGPRGLGLCKGKTDNESSKNSTHGLSSLSWPSILCENSMLNRSL